MSQHEVHRVRHLFALLNDGALEEFLAGCADDLVLHVRGSSPRVTAVGRSEIPDWYRSVQALTGTTLRATVELVVNDEEECIVVLHHTFERDGAAHHYESMNLCALVKDRLAFWSSYPTSLSGYATAWGVGSSAEAQPV